MSEQEQAGASRSVPIGMGQKRVCETQRVGASRCHQPYSIGFVPSLSYPHSSTQLAFQSCTTILYSVELYEYRVMRGCTGTVQHRTAQYTVHGTLYCTVLYCTVQHFTIECMQTARCKRQQGTPTLSPSRLDSKLAPRTNVGMELAKRLGG